MEMTLYYVMDLEPLDYQGRECPKDITAGVLRVLPIGGHISDEFDEFELVRDMDGNQRWAITWRWYEHHGNICRDAYFDVFDGEYLGDC